MKESRLFYELMMFPLGLKECGKRTSGVVEKCYYQCKNVV